MHNTLLLLKRLAGAPVQTGFSSFQFDGLNENILLILLDAGPSQDLIESLMRYLQPAFLAGDEVRTQEFSRLLQRGIAEIRDTESSEKAQERITEVEKQLINVILTGRESAKDDTVETRTEKEIAVLENAPWVPQSLADKEGNEYLMRIAHVRSAVGHSLALAKRARTSFSIEPNDQPIF